MATSEPVDQGADDQHGEPASAGLGEAPGATTAWLVGDIDKTVRQLVDEVPTAD
jgi:hypothetical protein